MLTIILKGGVETQNLKTTAVRQAKLSLKLQRTTSYVIIIT